MLVSLDDWPLLTEKLSPELGIPVNHLRQLPLPSGEPLECEFFSPKTMTRLTMLRDGEDLQLRLFHLDSDAEREHDDLREIFYHHLMATASDAGGFKVFSHDAV